MTAPTRNAPLVAIACGGTGGHLFPGIAVGAQLVRRGCAVTLVISPKDVDQQAIRSAAGMETVTLPAVGLTRGGRLAFVRGFLASYRAAKTHFTLHPPQAALTMGGFTGTAPILAARKFGAQTFLHESNTIPGRANRWLAWVVDHAFVGFPETAPRLRARRVAVTGTPVRPQFQTRDAAACRTALGLDPARPVCLVMGGSQGAAGINDLVIQSLPVFAKRAPALQWFHLTGPSDVEKVKAAYAAQNLKASVHPFFSEMEIALGAASVAITRAGASSLAELAALRVPAVLIPYPAATDNHQFHNARAFEDSGAARVLEQRGATREALSRLVLEIIESAAMRDRMQDALGHWHRPKAAEEIADTMLRALAPVTVAGQYAPAPDRTGGPDSATTARRTIPEWTPARATLPGFHSK